MSSWHKPRHIWDEWTAMRFCLRQTSLWTVCGTFSWLLIDGEEPCPLWVVPPLGGRAWYTAVHPNQWARPRLCSSFIREHVLTVFIVVNCCYVGNLHTDLRIQIPYPNGFVGSESQIWFNWVFVLVNLHCQFYQIRIAVETHLHVCLGGHFQKR